MTLILAWFQETLPGGPPEIVSSPDAILAPTQPEQPRLVVFYNPNSTNTGRRWRRTRRHLARAALRAGYVLETVETEADPEENRQKIYANVRSGDVIAIAGGDGSVNDMGQAKLHEDAPQAVIEAPVLAVPMGNKSDLANTFNRFGFFGNLFGRGWRQITHALRERHTVSMYPMVAEFEPNAPADGSDQPSLGSFTKLAIYFMGFGPSGEGAKILNNREWREKHKNVGPKVLRPLLRLPGVTEAVRLWREAKMAAKIVLQGDTIEIGEDPAQTDDEDPSATKRIRGLDFINGPRVAGMWRFLIEPYTREMIVSTVRGRFGVLVNMAARMLHVGFGEWHRGKHSLQLANETPMTFDGEHFSAPAGQVTVTHSERAIQFITSRRKYWGKKD